MITGKGESVPNTETEIDTAFKLTLISKRAKGEPRTKFTSLMHLLDAKYLKECYGELKRGKAAGIDGKVVEGYTEAEITQAIEDTILELKKRTYRPQPVRRVYIEKANGQKRPLGIPTVMDKVIQRGVAKILEAIYEPTFLNISYGFRPGRNAHECLKELNHKIMGKKVNWVIEADIKGVGRGSIFDKICGRFCDMPAAQGRSPKSSGRLEGTATKVWIGTGGREEILSQGAKANFQVVEPSQSEENMELDIFP